MNIFWIYTNFWYLKKFPNILFLTHVRIYSDIRRAPSVTIYCYRLKCWPLHGLHIVLHSIFYVTNSWTFLYAPLFRALAMTTYICIVRPAGKQVPTASHFCIFIFATAYHKKCRFPSLFFISDLINCFVMAYWHCAMRQL